MANRSLVRARWEWIKEKTQQIHCNAKTLCDQPRSSKLCPTQKKALGVNRAFIFKVCSAQRGGGKRKFKVTNIIFEVVAVILPNAWSLP